MTDRGIAYASGPAGEKFSNDAVEPLGAAGALPFEPRRRFTWRHRIATPTAPDVGGVLKAI